MDEASQWHVILDEQEEEEEGFNEQEEPTFLQRPLARKCLIGYILFLFVSFLGHQFPTSFDPTSVHVGGLRISPPRRLQQPIPGAVPAENLLLFDLMVPAYRRDGPLREFATRLRPSIEDYFQLTASNKTRIGTFRLLITRYGEQEKAEALEFQKELADLSGLSREQIVLVQAPDGVGFTRANAVNSMLQRACHSKNCIVARIDVDMQLKASFYMNAERDVIPGEAVYFPIVWSVFHPASPELVQWKWDVESISGSGNQNNNNNDPSNNNPNQNKAMAEPRKTLEEFSNHRGHWRDYGTGMWAVGGPDAKIMRFNEAFKGWGGEDTDFYNRVKQHRKIIRRRDGGLIHLWHPKLCTKGVTVFTDNQINECNWSREGEKGSPELGQQLMVKWEIQHYKPKTPPQKKPIWQA